MGSVIAVEDTQAEMSLETIKALTKALVVLHGTTVVHKKTGNHYYDLGEVTNCTNAVDGQRMRLYMNTNKHLFVRDVSEFHEKFDAQEAQ